MASGGAIFLLMWMYSRDLKISAILFVSGAALVLGLLGATYILIAVGRKLGSGRMGAWQLAWARIKRRAMDNSVQLISFRHHYVASEAGNAQRYGFSMALAIARRYLNTS